MKLEDVKKTIRTKQLVRFRNVNYTLTACILRIKNNEWYYSAELHDLNANSVTIASLKDIEIETIKI